MSTSCRGLGNLRAEHNAAPRNASRAGAAERPSIELAPLVERLEELAAETGKLRAVTEVAESTEKRLTAELVEQRARVAELEAREAQLAGAGPFQAWRLARQLRRGSAD